MSISSRLEIFLINGGPNEGSHGAGGDSGEFAEELAVVERVGFEPFGYGEHDLAVGDVGE